MGPFRKTRWQSLWLIGLIAFGVLEMMAGGVDPWAYFYPEQVKSFGCKVTDTQYVVHGMDRGETVWMATAFARREKDDWQMEIATYPHTLKGRHAAEKACMKWQDDAEKRVNRAQPAK